MQATPALPEKVTLRQAQLLPELIAEIWQAVQSGQAADVALNQYFKNHREFGSRDRKLFRECTFSYFRWKGWLGENIDPVSIVQSFLLDSSNPHPTIERMAESLPDLLPLTPKGDGTVEEKAVAIKEWQKREQPPALENLFPAQLSKWSGLSKDLLAKFGEACQTRPPVWLRTTTANLNKLRTQLKNESIPHEQPYSTIPLLKLPAGTSLGKLSRGTLSWYTIQDLASVCVGLICTPGKGQKWWDVCAGAGGKSLHLAELMENSGRVVATDIRSRPLAELHRRVKLYRLDSIRSYQLDQKYKNAPVMHFSGILVDAPCSGLGTWSRNPDARWRTEATHFESNRQRQLSILARAHKQLTPGGYLVYAVCSLAASETTSVIASFLKKNPEYALVPVKHPLTGVITDGQVTIYPWDGPCNGMYIARMQKGQK